MNHVRRLLLVFLITVINCFLLFSSTTSAFAQDIRYSWATSWASSKVGSHHWFDEKQNTTLCELFIENAYGVTNKYGSPDELFASYGIAGSPSIPGQIVVFDHASGYSVGHAGLYMGGGQMISVRPDHQYGSVVQWDPIATYGSQVATLRGYVNPPDDWPGVNDPKAVKDSGSGGYCSTNTSTSSSSQVQLSLSVLMPGIGHGGNSNPVHRQRDMDIQLINESNQ